MRRYAASLAAAGLFLLVSTAAGAAQTYLMTGKFANSTGPDIDIPLVGNNPGGVPNCGQTTKGEAMIPGMSPIFQGYRTSITMTMVATPPITATMFANPHGCVSGAGKIVATAPGAGKAFHMPTKAFSRPLPGMTVAISIPRVPIAPQLATSLAVTAPPMSPNLFGTAPAGGTMNNGMNTAKFRYFHKSAWLTQTGRAGAKFTWCFGNAACTMVSQAMGVDKKGDPNLAYPVHQVFVKYTPGPNRFGGTMSHVFYAGPNLGSIALSLGGALQFLGIVSDGERVTGRGYADFHFTPLMGGPAFAMFAVGPVYIPQLMETQSLITSVMTPIPGSGSMVTAATNKIFGFAFTTGTVLARNTGTDIQKNPAVGTLTGMGGDSVTAMGVRNISLVAGAVLGSDTFGSEGPVLTQVFMPEPSSPASLVAGVAVLLGIAVRRARAC